MGKMKSYRMWPTVHHSLAVCMFVKARHNTGHQGYSIDCYSASEDSTRNTHSGENKKLCSAARTLFSQSPSM